MRDISQYTPQQRIVHYRERARVAIERAAREPQTRSGYLDLARSWNTLAEALELELGLSCNA
jgi:hypothetical protein